MKRPCAWCGERPAVYLGSEYCNYKCEDLAAIASNGGVRVYESEPLPEVPEETTCIPVKRYLQLRLFGS